MWPPSIDSRTREKLASQLTALVHGYTSAEHDDPVGGALVGIGARYAELVVERLNLALDRNYLAFLNLVGVEAHAPQPARVPLTFALARGGRGDVTVPAGTRVAAPPSAGTSEEIVFETQTALVLTNAELVAAFATTPGGYTERTDESTGKEDAAFDPFAGTAAWPAPHQLYLAGPASLTAPGEKTVTLRLSTSNLDWTAGLTCRRWHVGEWTTVPHTSETGVGELVLTLAGLPAITPHEVAGVSAPWLSLWVTGTGEPEIGRTVAVTVIAAAPAPPPPDAYSGHVPMDPHTDFLPFGAQPRFNDTCFVTCPDEPGEHTLHVELTNPAGGAGVSPVPRVVDAAREIDWSVSTSTGWEPVAVTWRAPSGTAWEANPSAVFTRGGDLRLTVPAGAAPAEVNGRAARWLRARLRSGDYGNANRYKAILGADNQVVGYQPDPGFAPPLVATLRWLPPEHPVTTHHSAPIMVSGNDFTLSEHSTENTSIRPFGPAEDQPALYLGFDAPFPANLVTLYLSVPPPESDHMLSPAADPLLAWQYLDAGGWRELPVSDETDALTRSGLVRFTGPPRQPARWCFGRRAHWLRVRWCAGTYRYPPRLRRVLPNTTWAAHVTTVTSEVIGSGTGARRQEFGTARTPVLDGETVEVRELDGTWARWIAVPDFHDSGPADSHYAIDRAAGRISFGDGVAGRLLPSAQHNVRVSYRTGGGPAGNRPAATITKLKSGVPYVGGATNHEPAQGGAAGEPLERVRERGPAVLRHGRRAVTARDLEDLAIEASSEVALAHAVTPTRFDPNSLWLEPGAPLPSTELLPADAGLTTVVVVPHGDEPRPEPTGGLLNVVERALVAACPLTVRPVVTGPEWVRVTVTATAVARSVEAVDGLARRVVAALTTFLHPLYGGPGGTGAGFGRLPHASDLYAVVREVSGVDHVPSLTVDLAPQTRDKQLREALTASLRRPLARRRDPVERYVRDWLDRALGWSGEHHITVEL